ncbi:hypothetical protein DFH27DRAFT_606035 [Peziza echinospora]|nr:hypothetical protein DFH27DRAFT_606035 [Peziza echinospora]
MRRRFGEAGRRDGDADGARTHWLETVIGLHKSAEDCITPGTGLHNRLDLAESVAPEADPRAHATAAPARNPSPPPPPAPPPTSTSTHHTPSKLRSCSASAERRLDAARPPVTALPASVSIAQLGEARTLLLREGSTCRHTGRETSHTTQSLSSYLTLFPSFFPCSLFHSYISSASSLPPIHFASPHRHAMHPEYSSPMYATAAGMNATGSGSPSAVARKRRRDEGPSQEELEFVAAAAASAWGHHHHLTPTSKLPMSVASASSKLIRQSPRMASVHNHTIDGSFKLHHHSNNRASPKHKRTRPASSSPNCNSSFSNRSRSSSPYSNSQRMHLSPEFSHATLPTPTAGAVQQPPPSVKPIPQRCHICSRLPLLTYSAIMVSPCEQCSKPACSVCARECASCDEKVCGKCCKEKGDYTFCLTCFGIMERGEKANQRGF